MKMIFEQIRKRLPVVVVASALAAAGAALAYTNKPAEKTKSGHAAINVPLDETSVPREGLPRGSFAPIVKKVAPAVVKIETTTTIKNGFSGTNSGTCFPLSPPARSTSMAWARASS
jgi:S1-C subfamily serine protease